MLPSLTMPPSRLKAEPRLTATAPGIGVMTDRLTVMLWSRPSSVPVSARLVLTGCAVTLAVSVRMLAADEVDGLNEAVTPAGRPEADKPTLPLKPLTGPDTR